MTTIQIPKQYAATVVAKEQYGPTLVRLELAPQVPVPFVPGQYASFLIGDKRRPFSFAGLPTEPTLQFVVSTSPKGVGSTYVESLHVGDTVTFLAPYGRFVLQYSPRPCVFIATGAGIAPIRTLLLQALTTQRKTWLFLGNHNEHYMIFHDEFSRLAQDGQLTYIPTLSEAKPDWTGQKGLVTTLVPQTIKNLPEHDFYICGSPAMCNDMVAVLETAGVPKTQIYREAFV